MTYEKEIAAPRREIDRLNNEILTRIAERVSVAMRIAEIKRRYGRPVIDPHREEKVLDVVRLRAAEMGLDSEAAARIFAEIIRLTAEAEARP
jgi:chorismate mutase